MKPNFFNSQVIYSGLLLLVQFLTSINLVYSQPINENVERDVLVFEDIKAPIADKSNEVFSASRSNKALQELPFTVLVVSREEIIKNGYITLVDVLKSLPGIKVSQPGSGEDGELFLFRGLIGNSYTKILINGIPIQPSTLGGIPLGAQLPVRQAERIEVIYGPSSALYGADATAGVINIITKKAEKGVFAHGDVEVGNDGYQYVNFMLGGKAGRDNKILSYSIYGSRFKRDHLDVYDNQPEVFSPFDYFEINDVPLQITYRGMSISPDDPADLTETFLDERLKALGADEATIESVKNDYFVDNLINHEDYIFDIPQASENWGADFNYKGLRFSINSMYRRDHPSLGRSPFLFSFRFPQIYVAERISRYSLSYDKNLNNKVSIVTNLSYLRYRTDSKTAFSPVYRDGELSYIYAASDDFFGEQLLSINLNENIEIVSGASFQYSSNLPRTNELDAPFNPKDYTPFRRNIPEPNPLTGTFGYNPVNFNNMAVFAQVYASYTNFNLIAGFRADRNSLYGSTINPRVAGIYKMNKSTSLEASFGTAFKAPASSVIYNSLSIDSNMGDSTVIYAIIPNTELDPEVFQSFEVGFKHNFTENLSINFTGFHNRITDLIKGSLQTIDTTLYQNVAEGNLETRTSINSKEAKATLFGLQLAVSAKELYRPIDLGFDAYLTLTEGRERLAGNEGNIRDFRMMPEFIGQLKINATFFEKLYINAENIFMTDWFRRFTPNLEAFSNPLYKNDGYYTLDLMASYQVNENFSAYCRVKNVFDAKYGGIGATGLDIDMLYNPQLARNAQIGLRFVLD